MISGPRAQSLRILTVAVSERVGAACKEVVSTRSVELHSDIDPVSVLATFLSCANGVQTNWNVKGRGKNPVGQSP